MPPHKAGCYTTALKVWGALAYLAAATGTTLAEGFPRPGWESHHWLRPHTQAQSPPWSVANSCWQGERQTQGYCALHSTISHFQTLQTRFIKSHMAETPQRYQVKGKEAAGRREWKCVDGTEIPLTDICLCKQFYYQFWKPHCLTERLNLGIGYSSHLYASAHTPLGKG